MRRTTMCPDCDGSGGAYGKMDLPMDAFIWEPRCFTCNGAGLLQGNALVHLPALGSDLVTVEYVWKVFHLARHFVDGYREAQDSYHGRLLPELQYATVRDYLYDFELEEITVCQVALYLTTFLGIGERDRKWHGFFNYFSAVI